MGRTGRSELNKNGRAFAGRTARLIFVIFSAAVLSFLTACQLPDFGAFLKDPGTPADPAPPTPPDTIAVNTSAEQILLEWDPPAEEVSSYDVYIRTHGAASWQVLGSVSAAPAPEYAVLHSAVGNGEFDFAIVAMNGEGTRSTYHSSLDATAQPDTGWYLVWYR